MLSNKYNHIIYPSETVVTDKKNKQVVSCPTEDEAVEYIREVEGEATNED